MKGFVDKCRANFSVEGGCKAEVTHVYYWMSESGERIYAACNEHASLNRYSYELSFEEMRVIQIMES